MEKAARAANILPPNCSLKLATEATPRVLVERGGEVHCRRKQWHKRLILRIPGIANGLVADGGRRPQVKGDMAVGVGGANVDLAEI